jgi:hypothetical protein
MNAINRSPTCCRLDWGHRRYKISDVLRIKQELFGSIQPDLAAGHCTLSARLYGSMSHKNKKLVDRLKEAANGI